VTSNSNTQMTYFVYVSSVR